MFEQSIGVLRDREATESAGIAAPHQLGNRRLCGSLCFQFHMSFSQQTRSDIQAESLDGVMARRFSSNIGRRFSILTSGEFRVG